VRTQFSKSLGSLQVRGVCLPRSATFRARKPVFPAPAHQTVLGATLEFIKLPYDLSGEILTKSSVARTFIVVETAPWIHPEYRGCLTLEIANVSNVPVLLYPGRSIGQLILLAVGREREEDSKLNRTYFGPVYPEGPSFSNPDVDLRRIGVRRTDVIRFDTKGPQIDL
jgi:dUTPase